MKRSLLFFSTVLLYLLITPSTILAQSGKVAGRITDGTTGEPLPFVNVIIMGTTAGAASDLDGYYTILNVRPGNYNVKASAIGYQAKTVENIRVSIDLTTKVDFTLVETSVALDEEVVVLATKPLVTKDRTASAATIGADEIDALPVTEFTEVLELKAGVVKTQDGFNVRGGRRGEVTYSIDGVPVTDVYDGSTVVDVNASSIQELQFVSGAFNAEYGKALSGVINLATKEGNNEYSGSLSSYIGDYVSDRTDIFLGADDVEPTAIRNLEGSFSGPVIKDKLYFYTNARYVYFDGWLKGRRVYNPWDITFFDENASTPEDQYNIQQTGDNEIVSMNFNERVVLQGKLTYQMLDNLKLTFNYINDRRRFQDYDHDYKFNPDGRPKKFQWGVTNILKITHTLGSNTFYELAGSYFHKKFDEYVHDNINSTLWVHPSMTGQEPQNEFSFNTGGQDNSTFKRITDNFGIKFDITSQVTRSHQVKAGIEFNQNKLFFEDITLLPYWDGWFNGRFDETRLNGRFDPGEDGIPEPDISGVPFVNMRIPDINNPDENNSINIYERKPFEFSAYIQDKIEFDEMIVNIGIRFDYFDSDGFVLSDPSDPDIYRPKRPENIAKTLEERRTFWYKDVDPKIAISPRLGVAFPITDRGVIHFSYGHFFQAPKYELLYRNPEFKLNVAGENFDPVGNSDLEPEQTISGEIGLQQALTDQLTVDLTGYFRDIKDLTGSRADRIRTFGGAGSYFQFVNSDFGFVRGIVFTLSKRFSNNWAATIDYTLQTAKGNASDPEQVADQRENGEEPEVQLVPLNWDQTHTVNLTFTYSPGDWGFSMIAQYGSGFPYTPSQSENLTKLLTNSLNKPSFFNADLKAYYDFNLFKDYKITFFARVFNLFDIRNEVNVYDDTGTADFTEPERLRRLDGSLEIVNSIDEFYRNPTFYSEPRRIELGATIAF